MKEERVILVDKIDNQIGTMPKMEAHQKAILHRAFSVFILNERSEADLIIFCDVFLLLFKSSESFNCDIAFSYAFKTLRGN